MGSPAKTKKAASAASDELVGFGTRIPEKLAREVKAAAMLEGQSVQAWVADALQKKLNGDASSQ